MQPRDYPLRHWRRHYQMPQAAIPHSVNTLLGAKSHLDSLTEQIKAIEQYPIEKTCVHIIDREGDSIAHLREMSSQGFKWLIRAKEGHRIEHQGKTCKVAEAAERVETQQVQPIAYKGNRHMLHVGETAIRITRAAKPKRNDDSGQRVAPQPGSAIEARLIVAVVKMIRIRPSQDGH